MERRKCDVCKKPLKKGQEHKHRYAYCSICKRKTVHITAAFGLPWSCFEKHPNDYKACAKCGASLDKNSVKIARRLGASKVFCRKCSPKGGTGLFK